MQQTDRQGPLLPEADESGALAQASGRQVRIRRRRRPVVAMESVPILTLLAAPSEVLHGGSLHNLSVGDQVGYLHPEEVAPTVRLMPTGIDGVITRKDPLLRLPQHYHQVSSEGLVLRPETLVRKVVCQARAHSREVLVGRHLLEAKLPRADTWEAPEAHDEGAAALWNVHIGKREHLPEPLAGIEHDEASGEARNSTPNGIANSNAVSVPSCTACSALAAMRLDARSGALPACQQR
mmetsp:Transcript_42576/g.132445  ORF Transcript_42576/g.132445 Transcript_42576/m.132445 type:complete len:237 (-) Transcript_42576:99-809(-)